MENKDFLKIIKKLVKIFELDKKYYPKISYINALKKSTCYRQGNLRLRAIKNDHIKDSFGIKFEFEKKALFYTSDTSFSSKMLKKAERLDYLIHDCTASSSYFKKHPTLYKMHTNAKDLAKYLKLKPKIKTIPVHFLLLRKGEEKRIRKELKAIKNVIFVKDFQGIFL